MTTLLRLPAVMERTGMSRSKIYELLERGEFVRPAKVAGGRINFWASSEIDEWIEARLSERQVA